MKTYKEHISNYIYNHFKFKDVYGLVTRLYTNITAFKFTIPNQPIELDIISINLPLVNDIHFTNGINRISLLTNFEHSNMLRYTIDKRFKLLLNELNILPIQNIYHYSRFNWYLSNYTNEFNGISNLSGDQPAITKTHPFLLLLSQRLLPSIITDYPNNLKNKINQLVYKNKIDLRTEFKRFLDSNLDTMIDEFTSFIIQHIITMDSNYSNDLFIEIRDIITEEFKSLPEFKENFNIQLAVNNIFKAQIDELLLNILNSDFLKSPATTSLFASYTETDRTLNVVLDSYLKEFNNAIVNNINGQDAVLESLQIIVGQYKTDIPFLLNSIYLAHNSILELLKSEFNETLLPANFSKDLVTIILSNLDTDINLKDFRDDESKLITETIHKYFMIIINNYVGKTDFQEFILRILSKIEKYNLQSTTYYYGVFHFIKLYFIKAVIDKSLFNTVVHDFINVYAITTLDELPINFNIKVEKLYNYSGYDIVDYDVMIFDFIYSSVILNICDAFIEDYIF